MIKSEDLQTRKCVENNRNLFEDVAKGYTNAKDMYRSQYSILDYELILDNMIEYITGYAEYAKSDDRKYENKVLTVSRNFYDRMFVDKKKYRKKITLNQFKDLNKAYLKKTKELQDIMENYLNDPNLNSEMHSLLRLTDNQYKKIAKVHRDDMKIYLWLTTSDSKFFAYNIDASTRSEYNNKMSPVMHKAKNTLDD